MKKWLLAALLVVGVIAPAMADCIAVVHCLNGDFQQFVCQAPSGCTCTCFSGGTCAKAIIRCPDGTCVGYACCNPTA